MITEIELTSILSRKIKSYYEFNLSAAEMLSEFNKFKREFCYTTAGRNRYRKGYIDSLLGFFLATKDLLINDYCLFGYKYKGEFYTTYKGSNKLTSTNNLKTTKVLHDLKLSQSEWDQLESGMYYAHNLRKHY